MAADEKRGLWKGVLGALAWAAAVTGLERHLAPWSPDGVWGRIALVNLLLAAALTTFVGALPGRRTRLAAWLILVAGSLGLVPRNVRAPRAVVWVVCDTLRADALSLYGYDKATTPFLDAWRGELVVFDEAYSQASHTLVSAPSILASLYPSTHGLDSYTDVLDPEAVLVSELLAERGWATFGAVANPHLGRDNGFGQGWDEYTVPSTWKQLRSERLNRRFFDWRRELEARKPYFALLWYIDPHTPFRYDAEAADWAGLDSSETGRWRPQVMDASADETLRHETRRRYDAAVRSVDTSLAELVRFLREAGDWDDALFLFTSDHGESMWEHGRYGHNYGLYQHLNHVPLVARFPSPLRFPAFHAGGRRVSTIVSSVDLLPTTLDWLDLPADPRLQGRSFLDRIDEPGAAYLEQHLTQYGPYRIYGLREGPWKYIWQVEFEGEEPREMLFDLERDPGERTDLADERPEVAARFRARVEELRGTLEAAALGKGTTELDQATLESLRELGY